MSVLSLKCCIFFLPKKFKKLISYCNYLMKLEFLQKFFLVNKKISNNIEFTLFYKKFFPEIFFKNQIFFFLKIFRDFLSIKFQEFSFMNLELKTQSFFKKGINNFRKKILKNFLIKKNFLISKQFKRFYLSLMSIGNILLLFTEKFNQNLKMPQKFYIGKEKQLINLFFKLKNFFRKIFFQKFKKLMLVLRKVFKIFF
jgi:hypothetical protein